MTSIDKYPERQKDEELGGLDLDTAKLDDMSQALGRLEFEKRGLLENIRILRVRLADEKEDQGDVYYYLHKKLDDNYDVISALERQLMVETADREKAETEYARQIEELDIRKDDELGPLKQKLTAEEEQLNGMHEAAKNKQEADANRARLEAEIETTESTVENDLNTERRKKLQEKQRVRRQVEDEIAELSCELFSKKEIELADKTVRAKDNNEKLHAALQAKARQAERMTVMNQGLAFENRSLRNDVDLAKASEAVLDKDVRLFHDLVINLKARLEQEACDAEEDTSEEQELAELEVSLASGGGGGGGGGGRGDTAISGLDTMSLSSDTPPGAQVIWAGGACGALAYESVDELRVAVESLQRLHAELQEEARNLTARVEESRAAGAAAAAASGRTGGGEGGGNGDPIASCLLEAAEVWMVTSRTTRPSDEEPEELDGGGRGDGSGLLTLPASVGGQRSSRHSRCDDNININSGRRGSLRSNGRKTRLRTTGSSSSSKQEKIVVARRWSTEKGGRAQQGPPLQQDQVNLQSSPSGTVGNSGGGALAAATKTPLRRREIFYHLVDAFRDYQTRARRQQTTAVNGAGVDREGLVGGEEWGEGSVPEMGPSTAAAATGAEGGGGTGGSNGNEFPPIGVLCGGGGGGGGGGCGSVGGGGASVCDSVSASVRTLCDFGPPECCSVSTQTIAKHFPEKFASVKPPRRLVVNNTFLTSNSTVTNSVQTVSTARSWGYGAVSLDSQPDRRL